MQITAFAETKYIALTFDDGPNTGTCTEVLRKLKEYNIPATFFVTGNNINHYTGAVLQQMLSQDCQIGVHSYNHYIMKDWTLDELNADFQKVTQAIQKYVDYTPTVMRWPNLQTPYVWEDFAYPAIGSGIDTNDWNDATTQSQIEDAVINNAGDGKIVLLHCFEGRTKTVSALDTIIPTLQEQGYVFVTIDELFAVKGQPKVVNPESIGWPNFSNGSWQIVPQGDGATTTAQPALDGDVNSDGKVSSLDVMEIKRNIADQTYKVSADLTGDGKVTSSDILSLKRIIANG